MSIVRKLEMALGIALLAAVAFLAVEVGVYRMKARTAQENYQVASGDAKAAGVYIDAYKRVEKQRSATDAKVESTLEANGDWADAPVPDDVADLLRHPTGSTSAVP